MATLVLTARWLGPQGRGIGVVVMTWTSLVSSIGYLSLGQVCVHRAANERDLEWVGPVASALAIVAAVATLLGWAGVAAAYLLAGDKLFRGIPATALALGFAALPFVIWEQYGSALLSVVGRLQIYNVNQIIGRTIGLLVLAASIRFLNLGVYGFLAAFVVGQVLISSAGIVVIVHHARGRLKGGLRVIGGLVRDGIKLHLNSIGVLLFSGADIVMLQYFRGPAEAGIFQLPMQLFLAMLLVPQSAQLALQGRVASRSPSEFWRDHRAIIAFVVSGMTFVAAALWLIAPWLVILIGSHRFEPSVSVFRILLVATPVAAFNTLMVIQWITRGYFLQASVITLTTGLLNCGLNLELIPRFGATGAALATVGGVFMVPLMANGWMALRAERDFKQTRARSNA